MALVERARGEAGEEICNDMTFCRDPAAVLGWS